MDSLRNSNLSLYALRRSKNITYIFCQYIRVHKSALVYSFAHFNQPYVFSLVCMLNVHMFTVSKMITNVFASWVVENTVKYLRQLTSQTMKNV